MKKLLQLLFVVSLCSLTFAQWNSQFDYDGNGVIGLGDFAIFAANWGEIDPELSDYAIDWVTINDPGISGHEGFSGQMSKYEMTNAQYCKFLNAALASGDISVDGNFVKGASGFNSGADFVGTAYYQLDGAGYSGNGATAGGASRINYTGGVFTVDSGFEMHPVTYVSWYGATSFCCYYGYRLPTEWQWQAVADYNGSYQYGCGNSITMGTANVYDSAHPYGTTSVGAFGSYGYGMSDMAGNVFEWVGALSDYEAGLHFVRGGSWYHLFDFSNVGYNGDVYPDQNSYIGFRVCR